MFIALRTGQRRHTARLVTSPPVFGVFGWGEAVVARLERWLVAGDRFEGDGSRGWVDNDCANRMGQREGVGAFRGCPAAGQSGRE